MITSDFGRRNLDCRFGCRGVGASWWLWNRRCCARDGPESDGTRPWISGGSSGAAVGRRLLRSERVLRDIVQSHTLYVKIRDPSLSHPSWSHWRNKYFTSTSLTFHFASHPLVTLLYVEKNFPSSQRCRIERRNLSTLFIGFIYFADWSEFVARFHWINIFYFSDIFSPRYKISVWVMIRNICRFSWIYYVSDWFSCESSATFGVMRFLSQFCMVRSQRKGNIAI